MEFKSSFCASACPSEFAEAILDSFGAVITQAQSLGPRMSQDSRGRAAWTKLLLLKEWLEGKRSKLQGEFLVVEAQEEEVLFLNRLQFYGISRFMKASCPSASDLRPGGLLNCHVCLIIRGPSTAQLFMGDVINDRFRTKEFLALSHSSGGCFNLTIGPLKVRDHQLKERTSHDLLLALGNERQLGLRSEIQIQFVNPADEGEVAIRLKSDKYKYSLASEGRTSCCWEKVIYDRVGQDGVMNGMRLYFFEPNSIVEIVEYRLRTSKLISQKSTMKVELKALRGAGWEEPGFRTSADGEVETLDNNMS